jgi:hypothetical protein
MRVDLDHTAVAAPPTALPRNVQAYRSTFDGRAAQ